MRSPQPDAGDPELPDQLFIDAVALAFGAIEERIVRQTMMGRIKTGCQRIVVGESNRWIRRPHRSRGNTCLAEGKQVGRVVFIGKVMTKAVGGIRGPGPLRSRMNLPDG